MYAEFVDRLKNTRAPWGCIVVGRIEALDGGAPRWQGNWDDLPTPWGDTSEELSDREKNLRLDKLLYSGGHCATHQHNFTEWWEERYFGRGGRPTPRQAAILAVPRAHALVLEKQVVLVRKKAFVLHAVRLN